MRMEQPLGALRSGPSVAVHRGRRGQVPCDCEAATLGPDLWRGRHTPASVQAPDLGPLSYLGQSIARTVSICLLSTIRAYLRSKLISACAKKASQNYNFLSASHSFNFSNSEDQSHS